MNIEKEARRLEKGHFWGLIKYPSSNVADEYFNAAKEYSRINEIDSAIRCYTISAKFYRKDGDFISASECYTSCYILSKNIHFLDLAFEHNSNKLAIIDLYCDHFCSSCSYSELAIILKKIYYSSISNNSMKYFQKKVLYNWILAMIIGNDPIIEETLEKIPECVYTKLIINNYNNNKPINFCYASNMNTNLILKFNEKVQHNININRLRELSSKNIKSDNSQNEVRTYIPLKKEEWDDLL